MERPLFIRLAAALCMTLAACFTVQAQETTARNPEPDAVLNQSLRFSESVQEFTTDLVIPLYWIGPAGDRASVIFLDPRGSFTEGREQELNVGIGARTRATLAGLPVLLGANAYYDSRWTAHNNQFNQLGVGVEVLSAWIDARWNWYSPEDTQFVIDEQEITEVAARSRTVTGPSYIEAGRVVAPRTTRTTVTTTRRIFQRYETTMQGHDAEAGLKLPGLPGWMETRAFLGGYDFDGRLSDGVKGWKARLEIRTPYGITLDGEWYEDKELYGSDYFVGARVQLDLNAQSLARGKNPFSASPIRTRTLQDRLLEQVVRDPHVQTAETGLIENPDKMTSETAVESHTRLVDLGPAPVTTPSSEGIFSSPDWAMITPLPGQSFNFNATVIFPRIDNFLLASPVLANWTITLPPGGPIGPFPAPWTYAYTGINMGQFTGGALTFNMIFNSAGAGIFTSGIQSGNFTSP